MIPRSAPRAPSEARLRSLAALAISGALALEVSISLARAPTGSGDDVGRIEQELLPLRAALRTGDRVALPEAGEPDAVWLALQYALAPAVIRRVPAVECWAGRAGACLDGATHLLLPDAPLEAAAALGGRLGLAPVAVAPGGVLLARARR
jgi:hypothetical protein